MEPQDLSCNIFLYSMTAVCICSCKNDTCPCCGRSEADGVPFERIRRITGYLVGTLDKWNDAKRAEERDRVKHEVDSNFGD